MINFIAFVLCGIIAVYYGINGEVELFVLESGLALIQLPFMIQWIVRLF